MERTDVEGIYRKEKGVFVNLSQDKLNAYKRKKRHQRELLEQAEKINSVDERLNKLESSIDELKDLILKGMSK